MQDIEIQYGAIKNARDNGGWLPVLIVDGKFEGSTWEAKGYDKDKALHLANFKAKCASERYLGDYRVIIEEAKNVKNPQISRQHIPY